MTEFDWDRVNEENRDQRRIEAELRQAEKEGRRPRLGNKLFESRGLIYGPTSWKLCSNCGERLPSNKLLKRHVGRCIQLTSNNGAPPGATGGESEDGKKKRSKKSESVEILFSSAAKSIAKELEVRLKIADRPVRKKHMPRGIQRGEVRILRCAPHKEKLATRMKNRVGDLVMLEIVFSKVMPQGGATVIISLW